MNRVCSSAMLRDSARGAARGKTSWGVHTSQAIFNALTRAKHARLLTQISSFCSKRMLFEKYLLSSRDSVHTCFELSSDRDSSIRIPNEPYSSHNSSSFWKKYQCLTKQVFLQPYGDLPVIGIC